MIKRSFRWTRQPQERLGVNWDHPLARDLIEFGYMVAGKVPHSAAQLGRDDQPSVTGTATPEITKHGHATTVSGTGNYINLNRNISAPTMVASGWVRTRVNSLGVSSALLTSAASTQAVYAGHFMTVFTSGGLFGQWGDAGGTTDADRRWAVAAGAVTAGEDASFGFVCRAATDWSLYKNGASLSVTYGGTGGTYAKGTGNGTINLRNANTIHGDQSASAWAYWSRDLTDAEFWELEQAPFQLLTPYTRRVWVSVAGGAAASAPTAWRVQTSASRTAAWRVAAAASRGTAWRLLTSAARQTAWRVLTAASRASAWRVLASIGRATAWRVLATNARQTAWRVLTTAARGTAWRVLAAAATSTAWRVLASAARQTAWRVLGTTSAPTAWRVLGSAARGLAWRVLRRVEVTTGWRIGEALALLPEQIVLAAAHPRTIPAGIHPRLALAAAHVRVVTFTARS